MLADVKTVLVTGGAGFVGTAVVRELLDQTTARLVIVDSLRNGRREHLPLTERVVLRQGDLADAELLARLVAEMRPELVLHLAALHFIPYCNAQPGETLQVNVVGTQNLLEACRPFPPQRL